MADAGSEFTSASNISRGNSSISVPTTGRLEPVMPAVVERGKSSSARPAMRSLRHSANSLVRPLRESRSTMGGSMFKTVNLEDILDSSSSKQVVLGGSSAQPSPQPSIGSVKTTSASAQIVASAWFTSVYSPADDIDDDDDDLPSPKSSSVPKSTVECVAAALKGVDATLKVGTLRLQSLFVHMWLSSRMDRIYLDAKDKKRVSIQIEAIVSFKSTEKLINIEVRDGAKTERIDIAFNGRDVTFAWVATLSSLMSCTAKVKSRPFKDLAARRTSYSLFEDTWGGKPLRARKKVLDFILLGTIGRGAFGKVRLALSVRDRMFYAVKVISKSMLRKQQRGGTIQRGARGQQPDQLAIQNKEIAIMQRLQHPNVVQLKGLFDQVNSDRMYIIQEYMCGGQVMSSSRLEGAQPLSEERAQQIGTMVLSGLIYLHSQKIAHRDLKPENLLTLTDGTVKISDFGAAKAYEMAEVAEKNRATVGTPAFAAPEMCLSERAPPGPKEAYSADVWSFGATLFYIVYGKAPFVAKNVFAMYDCICSQPLTYPSSPQISSGLKEVLEKTMVKDPFVRPTLEAVAQLPWFRSKPGRTEVLSSPSALDAEVLPPKATANGTVRKGDLDLTESDVCEAVFSNSRSLLGVGGLSGRAAACQCRCNIRSVRVQFERNRVGVCSRGRNFGFSLIQQRVGAAEHRAVEALGWELFNFLFWRVVYIDVSTHRWEWSRMLLQLFVGAAFGQNDCFFFNSVDKVLN
eukprot:CAMPEP_0198726670 /NCGR_PEP_ID=MMETSP1475-20131203/3647_1 /TAXON_ID= ORGANISM="Unidentified sp., Strain CCMP1999" /NCGR_SAMPLE_ID=MMETSP1475 /ASSEMBLY_ACC=CAM_ASM_001111 /LENGTH=743 /DNA_ID=CAMNT_0044488619 /DNA_START=14 /DNA_END=2246 /DNA_ORIENTATION=-